jgi:hypothetical protein
VVLNLRVLYVLGGVEHPEGRHRGLQGIHGVPMVRKAFHQVRYPVFDPSVGTEIRGEAIELESVGKVTEEEKIGGFDKVALFGQDLNPKSPVFQNALLSVQIADLGFCSGNSC